MLMVCFNVCILCVCACFSLLIVAALNLLKLYCFAGSGYITRRNLKDLLGDDWTSARADTMMLEANKKGDGRIGSWFMFEFYT
jgi:hypothetical protein